MTSTGIGPKSLPLILARELASNLSTAMFLLDSTGTLVFYNDAAEIIIGKPFGELGEVSAADFGEVLEL
ncbi:MAG: PAS domain-containing protein, partial [Acidimicrobiia bacterium]